MQCHSHLCGMQQETTLQVLEASSTPCGSEGWQASNASAKKKTKKKQLQKAINSGQKVDRAVYRAVYGDAVRPSTLFTFPNVRISHTPALRCLWCTKPQESCVCCQLLTVCSS